MDVALYVGALAALSELAGALSVRVVHPIELGVVLRFGRVQPELRRPGLTAIVPVVDH
jgi:regulator of protease activity HflC (stomatin/prohibitin superfamily)